MDVAESERETDPPPGTLLNTYDIRLYVMIAGNFEYNEYQTVVKSLTTVDRNNGINPKKTRNY